ncbi:rhodanese-like domain-containing protein [Flammeovirgaceae bacterium SG7u.111]|nr:rhodanese-like domain-containing protein [Flammeovirgaceae bacterium SG7u.132]WPO34069.1 rhodanese-like domain-containing protein [Flammeovirgaceae bacterium SG7u.111]
MKITQTLLSLSLALLVFAACESTAQNISDERVFKALDAESFAKKLHSTPDAQLVDLRTPGEVAQGTLKNCEVIDYTQPDFRENLKMLDKDKPVFIYCAVGGRSNQSMSIFHEMGFKEVYDLKGGIKAWARLGYQIVR